LGNSGSSALAKGGSGDVLTGVIAGLVALGLSEDDAASLGVWIHGLAGRLAGKERGEYSVLARETADALLREDSFGV
ncbi:MAG: bifunctional ADP-dependent NAD(P)H-hydrate dehydratase/NAD(P)H-hydrate epimerase, partial [Clostridium sp.]|nr:bifunctional ADP-dependent NAD(P)H-hydrate dehydratase/NAD(P)H-hydrate epimerase [Clostridium sp.]